MNDKCSCGGTYKYQHLETVTGNGYYYHYKCNKCSAKLDIPKQFFGLVNR